MVKKHNTMRIITLLAAIITLIVLIIFLLKASFGFFQYTKHGDVVNIVTIKGLEVEIDSATDAALNLANVLPMTDTEGLNKNAFSFTINNTSSRAIDYTLKLLNDSDKQSLCFVDEEETIPCTLLPYQNIRYAYSINNGPYSEPTNLTSTGEIYYEAIPGNASTNVSIKIWIDDNAPNSIQNNTFFGMLILTGEKSVFNGSLPNTITVGDSYTIARTAKTGETIACTNNGVAISNTSALTVGKHTITCTSTISSNTTTSTKTITVETEQIPAPVSFATDSWATIQKAVQEGNLTQYNQDMNNGVLRDIDLDGDQVTHKLRIANTTSCAAALATNPNLTSTTACGFVIEFADIIDEQQMNTSSTNVGGYPGTDVMYNYVTNTVYNKLPAELKAVMQDTTVVSSHGNGSDSTCTASDTRDSNCNYVTTNQKIYLLDRQEVFGDNYEYNTAASKTRQLDYYIGKQSSDRIKVKRSSNSDTTGTADNWWLRSANSNYDSSFYIVYGGGSNYDDYATGSRGVSPAFRIGPLPADQSS